MIEDEIRNSLRVLNEDYEQIFEEFVSKNYLESIAKVLCYIPEERAKIKLQKFPEEQRVQLQKLIEKFKQDDISVNLQILQILRTYDTEACKRINEVIKQLSKVSLSKGQELIEEELGSNPVVLAKINSLRLTMSDILRLDNRSVQKLLREVSTTELAYALKMVPEEVKEKIFENMSKRAANTLKEDMEFIGAVRKEVVTSYQSRILAVLTNLEERGEIVFASSEDYVE